jgi:hypothetical protein
MPSLGGFGLCPKGQSVTGTVVVGQVPSSSLLNLMLQGVLILECSYQVTV